MDLNKQTYQAENVVRWYEKLAEITMAEKVILSGYRDLVKHANLLDIGIGGGRTTHWLSQICRSYIGIDYSPAFVKLCRRKFAELDIREIDARDLSVFKSGRFDAVNFSFNGIDYTDEAGRKKILSEIRSVLREGGLFFFSTHNRSHATFNRPLWKHAGLSFFVKLKIFLKLLPYVRAKTKYKKREVHAKDYAIINDAAHEYRLLTFYTTPAFLRQQLTDSGFGEIRFYSKKGEPVPDEKLDDWIFVTCKAI